jgi:WD40 repeat protein
MSIHSPEEEYKYWAFISYSHADQKWADWLHKSLETYGVPKVLVGKTSKVGVVPKRAYPIFRDRDELPSSADLGEKLMQALMQSRFLIVVCSPRAVASRWVNEEIKSFKSMGREDKVLCLIVDGEPYASEHPELGLEECFPEPVRYKVDANMKVTEERTEPIAADARRGKDGRENAKLKLLAGMFGVNFSDLKQRDAERRHRRMQLAMVVVMLVMCGFLVLAGQAILAKREAEGALAEAQRQREEAVNQKQRADKARAVAEEERKKAEVALKNEEVERNKAVAANAAAEAARKAAEESATNANKQKELALKAKEEEASARKDAESAKQAAVDAAEAARRAKDAAEESEKRVSRELSLSYFVEASRLIGDNHQPQGMAYLSKSLNLDSGNASAQARVLSLMASRNWALPKYAALKQDNPVVMTRFNPDGKTMLTASGKEVRIWDVSGETDAKALKILAHKQAVRYVDYSPDGQLIVSTSDDGVVQVWDAKTGEKKGKAFGHSDWVYTAAFSADSKLIVTASQDKSARVWNALTGEPKTDYFKLNGPVRWAAISADGKQALTASELAAQLWDVEKGQPVGQPMVHEGGVYYVAFSPDGKFAATASGDKTAKIWGLGGTNATAQVLKHNDWVNQVQFSPDGRYVVTCSSDSTAKIWEVPTGRQIGQTMQHGGAISMVAISPNARLVATASADRSARIWDLKTGLPQSEPLELGGEVKSVAFSPDGMWLSVGGADGYTKVWSVSERRPLSLALNHDTQLSQAVFSKDGGLVLTVADDRTVRIWSVSTGQLVGNPIKHDSRVTSAVFSPDGKFVATAADRYARVWNVLTGESVGQPVQHDRQVNTVAFRKDGQVILTASEDGSAKLWTIADGKPVGEAMKHDRAVRMASFSNDGTMILTASADKTAKLWDGKTGKALGPVFTHKGELKAAIFSNDGRMVATASDDKTARVWLSANGEALTPELRHDAVVNAVAFSSNQRYVVSVSDDRTARVWTADGGKPASEPLRHDAEVRAVSFSANGYFLVTVSKSNAAMVWDTAKWKPVTEPLKHDGLVRDASFSSDGRYVITASEDKTARLWLIALPGSIPDWFKKLTEGVAGYQLGEEGGATAIGDTRPYLAEVQKAIENQPADDVFATWAKWYLKDPANRPVMAFSELSTKDYLARRLALDDAAIESTLLVQPNHALALARYGRSLKDTGAADYFTGLAVRYEPKNPDVLWLRAGVLQAANQFEPAYELMTKAVALDPRASAVIGAEGEEINQRNRDNNFSRGWLPKGWVDRNRGLAMSAEYAKLAEGPTPGTVALSIKTTGSITAQSQLAGPRFAVRNREKQVVRIFAKSDKRTDFLLSVRPFLDPNERAYDLQVRTTDKWQEYKVTVNPSKDFAGEVMILVPGDGSVQIGNIQVSKE